MFDGMSNMARSTRSDYHLTLGKLIEALEGVAPDTVVVCSDNISEHPGGAISYRGYYSDLAFKPSAKPVTVAELLAEAKNALNQEFTGYKGGEFLMGPDAPLWIAQYGQSGGRAIIDISVTDGAATLIIKQV